MTYKMVKAVLMLALVLVFASQSFASTPAEIINNFAFKAGKILGEGSNGNFFFSPYSIVSAFSMSYAGAEGNTAGEIDEALGFSRDLHDDLGMLILELNDNPEISSANRVWLRKGLKLKDTYSDILANKYGSIVRELDFKGRTEASLKIINEWVSKNTNNRIQNLLQTLKPDTQMILTNAVYFNAEWAEKFNKELTNQEDFYITDTKSVKVPMMKMHGKFDYYETDGAKIIRLPYKGHKLSMVIVLPPKENNDVMANMTAGLLSALIEGLRPHEVDLWLPKFKTEERYELVDMFKALGVNEAFSNNADFSGITDDESLKIDQIIHQTFIELDEEKTEAAASTAIIMMRTTAAPMRLPKAEFHADHPFLYFVMDNDTGTILFMGRQTFGK